MLRLVWTEFAKQLRRPRTWVASERAACMDECVARQLANGLNWFSKSSHFCSKSSSVGGPTLRSWITASSSPFSSS